MKIIKIAAVLASTILIALFTLITTIENPEIELYEKTFEMLMKQEGVTSYQEIEERFPILIDIKSNLNRIAELNQIVQSDAQNPAPIMTKEKSQQLKYNMQKLRQLRTGVRTELAQLVATYAEGHP